MDKPLFDKRERIVAAAGEMIVRNGLQCSMADIAQVAGVATGTVYLYFKSKEDLIRSVYAQLTDQAMAALVVEHAPDVSVEARIRHYIDDYITFIWEDATRAILFEYLSNVPLIPADELRTLFAPVSNFTTKLMTDGQQAGVLRDMPEHDMGGFIGGGIRNTLKWRRVDGARLSQADRSGIAAMCWSAIAKQPA